MMRSAKKTYEIDMLHGAILPKLLRFAVPLTLSTMLQLLFNAADVVVVGRWAGDNSLAAVGSNTSLIALLTNMFLGLSIGRCSPPPADASGAFELCGGTGHRAGS